MNNLFSARFDLITVDAIDTLNWNIHGLAIDDFGIFFASDANVGDIIYINDFAGNQILRYTIKSIDRGVDKTSGADLYASIIWNGDVANPQDPIIGSIGIIGASSENLGLITLTDGPTNFVDESFLNSVKNYENFAIFDKASSLDSPVFRGTPLTPTPSIDSNDTEIANTKWVNEKIDNINGTEEYTALEDITAFSILYTDGNSSVGLADANTQSHADEIIGISLESKLKGDLIRVVLTGKVTNTDWTFAKTGQLVFVGLNGNFTFRPDSVTGFIQQIGIVVDKNTISLDLEEAILLT